MLALAGCFWLAACCLVRQRLNPTREDNPHSAASRSSAQVTQSPQALARMAAVDFGSDEELENANGKHSVVELDDEVQVSKNQGSEEVFLNFCTVCANMLYPLEDRANKRLLYACRNCGHKTRAKMNCVYRNELIKDSSMKLSQVKDDCVDDVTLQRTGAADCEKCGGTEAVFFMTHDDTMKVVSVCRQCRHKWIA
jgi:DNA-directed RNA polymerase II subunit RPB9